MAIITGRRWAFNFTCLFSSVFGLCLGASNTYITFLVLTAFVGFGVGGNIPIDTTITLEFMPHNKRFLLAVLSVFQPIGVVVCSAIAFAFIPTMSCSPNFSELDPLPSCATPGLDSGQPCCGRSNNMGWRYLLFTLGGITLAVFCLRFFVFRFRESPKYLISKGQDEKAIQVVQHIAKTNGKECHLSLATFEALKEEHDASFHTDGGSDHPRGASGRRSLKLKQRWREPSDEVVGGLGRYLTLFSSWGMARLTILVWLTYIMDFWGFTVAGQYMAYHFIPNRPPFFSFS